MSKEDTTDYNRTCYLIDRTVRVFPLARIAIKTPWYPGTVLAMVTPTPICDLVLGSIPGARDPEDPDPSWSDDDSEEVHVDKQVQVEGDDSVDGQSVETGNSQEEIVGKNGCKHRFLVHKDILYRQFTSGIMKEVGRLLSIKQLVTTSYHPACNGLVERFNASLKSILKKIGEEKPKDWDKYVAPILFAYRGSPHDSTGFSPFELLYGRTVRGPMTILRDLRTGEVVTTETKST